ncbi:MAG TPA: elongation factor G [Armatimonadetes bacterium]|nr:elongation factor G [Armatimonadota bacterium]
MADTQTIRNIALAGHRGAGKTQLVDAILFTAKATDRLGRVDEGYATTDFDQEEINRHLSINAALAFCEWDKHHINLVDTPGYADFMGETYFALRVVDAVVVVINATEGVEVETERIWKLANEYDLPRLVFINRMDGERASFEAAVEQVRSQLKANAVPLVIPLGAEAQLRGVVDILLGRAYAWSGEREWQEVESPAELQEEMESYREQLMEAAAEADDVLLEKYLEEDTLSLEEMIRGLRLRVLAGKVVPVLAGAGLRTIGVPQLLDYVVKFLPSPADRGVVEGTAPGSEEEVTREPSPEAPFCALAFKAIDDRYVGQVTYFRVYAGTLRSDSQVYNANQGRRERVGQISRMQGKTQLPVSAIQAGDIAAVPKLSATSTGDTLCEEVAPIILPVPERLEPTLFLAVHPRARGDEEKISSGLARLQEEDRALLSYRDEDTGELIIAGQGQLHLDVVVSRLREKFGVEVDTSLPKVAYRETIRRKAEAEGRYIKQTGGAGQYGVVHLRLEPLARGSGFEFQDEIVGGVVPSQYVPSVEKGVREAMKRGPLAGYPVVDVKVTLYDGKYHSVDSSDLAFQMAGGIGFRNAVQNAQPVLLEPIMNLEVTVPEEYMGDIIGDLNGRRGRILGMTPQDGEQKIEAQVPLAEMSTYATDLRSLTQGRGRYHMEFSHYEEVPPHISERIIAQRREELERQK